jgi:hypothetical protein
MKYDFLKKIVREAQLSSNLSVPLINARLAPYRFAIFRWGLSEIREQARRDGAQFVVLLVPTADDPEIQIEQFLPVKQLLTEMGIATVDLLETFVEFDDLTPVRVSVADKHPNREGHRRLFESLFAQIDSNRGLRRAFTGIEGGQEQP